MPDHCFALLDDATGTAGSRLYTGYAGLRTCGDTATLDRFWDAIDADMATGLHPVMLIDYEWGVRLGGVHPRAKPAGTLRVLLFKQLQKMSEAQTTQWLQSMEARADPGVAGLMALEPSVTPAQYAQAIDALLEAIRHGETYQVNYTYRLSGRAYGEPLSLYRRLRAQQPVAFGALVALPAAHGGNTRSWVLSFSPELFVRHDAGQLCARPMKGTAPRGADPATDERQARWLAADAKNRAENVMIVDLLRNDLGRLATTGTVQVPHLFSVEAYKSVFQMTSTVTASIGPGTTFPEVLRALFPCGSITGAPKVQAMKIIDRLESDARGLYTGSIGWMEPPAGRRRCGDFCLSVAIRTLTLEPLAPPLPGTRKVTAGVGGGIVSDSTAVDEYAETRTKLRFLTTLDPGFTLFETFRFAGHRIAFLEPHLARLSRSAAQLGFACDLPALRGLLMQKAGEFPQDTVARVRLDLSHDGSARMTATVIEGPSPREVAVVIADAVLTDLEQALVAHKTSCRHTYDKAAKLAGDAGAFEAIFFNRDGLLTEGARTNVFVRLQGHWYTPPLHCGLLPGVMREQMLRHGQWFSQREITRPMLEGAQALLVCNSVRGLLPARLVPSS